MFYHHILDTKCKLEPHKTSSWANKMCNILKCKACDYGFTRLIRMTMAPTPQQGPCHSLVGPNASAKHALRGPNSTLLCILSDLAIVDEHQLSQHEVGFTWVAHIGVRLKNMSCMYLGMTNRWLLGMQMHVFCVNRGVRNCVGC